MLPRDYYSSSLALIKKSNFTEGIKKIVFAPNCLFSSIILILLLSFFFSVYGEILQIHVVRHDAVLMINGYWGKMVSEGRWVNYFIFSLLKKYLHRLHIFFHQFFGLISYIKLQVGSHRIDGLCGFLQHYLYNFPPFIHFQVGHGRLCLPLRYLHLWLIFQIS